MSLNTALEETTDLQRYVAEAPGFTMIYDRFEPRLDLIDEIRALQPEAEVVIFCETWCGDCLRNVPRWTRIVEELPQWAHTILPREEPHASRYGVVRIPTIILFDPVTGREIGRIIENPVTSLEEDTLSMLQSYYGQTAGAADA